jgi:hypothetical protein
LTFCFKGLDEDDLDTPIKVGSSSASRDAKMSMDTMQIYDDVAALERELGMERKQTMKSAIQRRHDPTDRDVFIIDFGTDEIKFVVFSFFFFPFF